MSLIPLSPDAPRFQKLSAIHALGTLSSEVRPPETPATVTSLMSFSGRSKGQFSISTGPSAEKINNHYGNQGY